MSKSSSLIKNTAILGLGKFFSQFVGFLLLPLYTYYLQPNEYGLVDLITVYVTLVVPATTLQLEMGLFRYLIDARKDEDQKSRIISNVFFLALLLYFPWVIVGVAVGIILSFHLTLHVLALSSSMLCANLLLQMTRGLGMNLRFALASILIGSTTLVSAIVLIVILKLKTEGVLISMALGYFVAASYLLIRMRVWRNISWRYRDKAFQKDILGYSIPLVPNGVSWWLTNASGRTMIAIFMGTTANGLYAVASKYSSILASLFSVFTMAWAESASLYINDDDRDTFFSKVANSTLRLFGCTAVGIIAAMPFVFPIMVGHSYNEALLYIPILVIGSFFNVLIGFYGAVYIAKKLTRKVMTTSLAAGILNVILTACFVPFFGLWAAAAAVAISFFVMLIFRHFDTKKYVTISFEKSIIVYLLILGTLVISLYYIGENWAHFVALIIAVVFGTVMNRKDIRFIIHLISRKLKRA